MPDAADDRWEELKASLRDANDSLETANATYEESDVAQDVRNQLAPYFDPEQGRAKVIRDYAHSLSNEIASFDDTREKLVGRLQDLSAATRKAIDDLLLDMYRVAIEGVIPSGKPATDRPWRDAQEQRVKAKRELASLHTLGLAVGAEYAWSLRVSAEIIDFRRVKLAEYLGQVPRLTAGSFAEQLAAVVAEEGWLEIAKEALVEVAGASVPVANAALAVVRIAAGVREKVESLERHYKRGPLDSLFELAQETHDQNELIDEINSIFDEMGQFISTVSNPK